MADRASSPGAPAKTPDLLTPSKEATAPPDNKHELEMTSEPVVDTKLICTKACAARNACASRALRLSPEAIATVISLLDGFSHRMAASQVCHLWREVALEMPRLWSDISVHELAKVNWSVDEPDGREHVQHCDFESQNPARVAVSSNLHHVPLLLERSAKAPVDLSFRVRAHHDNMLEGSDLTAEDVCMLINKCTDNGTTYEKDRLARLFPGPANAIVDVLLHVSGLTDRLTSLTLHLCCPSWLFLLACLPPMSALKVLVIIADETRDEYDMTIGEVHSIPHSFWTILQTEATPALPVAFPALETLQVSGLPARNQWDPQTPRLKISQRRIEGLLCSLPSLERLDVGLSAWPDIEPDDDAEDGKPSGIENREERSSWTVLRNLKHVRLWSRSTDVEQATVDFGRVVDLIPLNPGCSLHYEVFGGHRSTFDKLLSVFSIDDFHPKALTVTRSSSSRGRTHLLLASSLCAKDTEGNTRIAAASVSTEFAGTSKQLRCEGRTLLSYLDAQALTSLTVDAASWNLYLVKGLVAPALEDLTFILSHDTLEAAAHGDFKPPAKSALRPKTVTFAVDDSIHDALERLRLGERPLWRVDDMSDSESSDDSDSPSDDSDSDSVWVKGYTPRHYNVHFRVFVRLLSAVRNQSSGAGKLEKLVVAKELQAVPKRRGTKALQDSCNSLVTYA